MGKKYIIELNDECNSEFKGIMVFGVTQEKQISVELIPEESMTHYTEDTAYAHGYTEAESKYREIRDELEKQAYQRGLADAWEAAKKLWDLKGDTIKVFRKYSVFDILDCYTASEVIEKIRQHEQEKEEQKRIQVGDEIEVVSGKAVVVYVDERKVRYVYSNGVYAFDYIDKVTKTGRHFPEIAEVLQKMRDNN